MITKFKRKFDKELPVDKFVEDNAQLQFPQDDEMPYTWGEFLGEYHDESF